MLQVVVIVGGLSAQKQERLLRSQPEIVIATPGRLWELAQAGNEHLSTLNRIR
jgi:ATP-dependent RNA helicase DDX24/MAK5